MSRDSSRDSVKNFRGSSRSSKKRRGKGKKEPYRVEKNSFVINPNSSSMAPLASLRCVKGIHRCPTWSISPHKSTRSRWTTWSTSQKNSWKASTRLWKKTPYKSRIVQSTFKKAVTKSFKSLTMTRLWTNLTWSIKPSSNFRKPLRNLPTFSNLSGASSKKALPTINISLKKKSPLLIEIPLLEIKASSLTQDLPPISTTTKKPPLKVWSSWLEITAAKALS